jgi:predicted phage terminase large subunit-like protein
MTTRGSRAEREALLALLEEKHRRLERRRLEFQREEILARCQTLHGFIEEFWYVLEPARPFVSGWALQAMCSHLEAVTDGRIKRLLETVPPGMMKSLMLVFWPAWEWGPKQMPHMQYLATSFSQANVRRDNMKMRRLITSEKYQALWSIRMRADQDTKDKFENTENGFREGRPFTSMTGGRGDRVLVDDPHSVDGAESDVEREAAVQTFREGITDRLNDVQTSAIVIIMQRLHERDVAGTVLSLDLGFEHLMLPMEFEAARRCRTSIGFIDPRAAERSLLFPERFPRAEIDALKKAKGAYAWSGQYQQQPTPRTGAFFDATWFQRYRDRPARLHLYGTSDYAVKPDGGDFTVHRVWGVAPSGDIYLVDGWRGQTASDVWIDRKLDLIKKWRPLAWFGEGGVIRHAIEPALKQRSRQRRIYCRFEWLSSIHDKGTRARGFQARAASKAVFIPEGPGGDEWVAELCAFPAGTHDDEVDAASILGRALDEAHPATKAIEDDRARQRDAWDDEGNEGGEGGWKTR